MLGASQAHILRSWLQPNDVVLRLNDLSTVRPVHLNHTARLHDDEAVMNSRRDQQSLPCRLQPDELNVSVIVNLNVNAALEYKELVDEMLMVMKRRAASKEAALSDLDLWTPVGRDRVCLSPGLYDSCLTFLKMLSCSCLN